MHRTTFPIVAGGMLLTLLGGAPAWAADTTVAPPQLSITITDGRDATDTGDALDYTITVENVGTADVAALVVTQSVPEGMTFGSADSAGTLDAATVSWTVDVAAGATQSLATTMTVGETPDELLRLATVACAQVTATDPPLVCASDSDQLPAGAAAEAMTTPAPAAAEPDDAGRWVAGGAGLLLLIGLVLVVVLRRRRTAERRTGTGPHNR